MASDRLRSRASGCVAFNEQFERASEAKRSNCSFPIRGRVRANAEQSEVSRERYRAKRVKCSGHRPDVARALRAASSRHAMYSTRTSLRFSELLGFPAPPLAALQFWTQAFILRFWALNQHIVHERRLCPTNGNEALLWLDHASAALLKVN